MLVFCSASLAAPPLDLIPKVEGLENCIVTWIFRDGEWYLEMWQPTDQAPDRLTAAWKRGFTRDHWSVQPYDWVNERWDELYPSLVVDSNLGYLPDAAYLKQQFKQGAAVEAWTATARDFAADCQVFGNLARPEDPIRSVARISFAGTRRRLVPPLELQERLVAPIYPRSVNVFHGIFELPPEFQQDAGFLTNAALTVFESKDSHVATAQWYRSRLVAEGFTGGTVLSKQILEETVGRLEAMGIDLGETTGGLYGQRGLEHMPPVDDFEFMLFGRGPQMCSIAVMSSQGSTSVLAYSFLDPEADEESEFPWLLGY